MTGKLVRIAAAFTAFVAAAPAAQAQYGVMPSVIGSMVGRMAAQQAEMECLSGGRAPNEGEIASARAGTSQAMSVYLRLAATLPADVTPAFMRKASMREWLRDGIAARTGAVEDPLARALAADGAAPGVPDNFYRASDGRGALAIWRVAGADGAPLGHYRVFFRTERRGWKLRRLELVTGGAAPAPITQFCHTPGDVEAHSVQVAEYEAEKARKRAEHEAREATRRTR